MILQKWNPKLHEYEPFETPAQTVVLYTPNMDFPCDCTRCGVAITYGESYTSKQIHTEGGLGYPVCENCYQEELKEEGYYGDQTEVE